MSHLARGAWIETNRVILLPSWCKRRTSQGVRGLKHVGKGVYSGKVWSHLARGAWIETDGNNKITGRRQSHLARGAWIETSIYPYNKTGPYCRTSQGVRGLKPWSDRLH